MGRPPVIPAEEKISILLSILSREMSLAEAGRRENVSGQSIGRWKSELLEVGKVTLVAGKTGPPSREEPLKAAVSEFREALGESAVEISIWRKGAEVRLGRSRSSRYCRISWPCRV